MADIRSLRQPPPAQKQNQQPGVEEKMTPQPSENYRAYLAAGKLKGKVALITGGDSGIGRAVAVLFAKEGANIAIAYLNEHQDAEKTKALVEHEGRRCVTFAGDVGDETFCKSCVEGTVTQLGHLDILVNNAAEQHPQERLEDISAEQLERTFRTNIFGYFHLAKAALGHMGPGCAIINTTSVTAYKGKAALIDYSATKGAIVAFTRSLSESLMDRRIRVNAVAPGPVWTPLIPASFKPEQVKEFGSDTLQGRPAEPVEIAPSFVFLACDDSSFMTGQVLHPNGGEVVGS